MNPVTTDLHRAETTALSAPATAGPQSLGELILDAAERYEGVALQYQRDGRTAYISYPELGAIAQEIARGLVSLGIDAGDRVAILGLTAPAWTLADCGALCAGAIVTPIYHTNSPEECAYVLAHSEARLVFCENTAQAAKIEEVREQCPALEHVVLLEGNEPGVITLGQLRNLGAEIAPAAVSERLETLTPDDIATLVYTSGTTGPPKGCMLSHRNLLSTTAMYVEQLNFNSTHSLYQFLPLAHVLARVAQLVALRVGARVIYWTGDANAIIDELAGSAPTHFPAVPRIYEKVHRAITARADDGPIAGRVLFRWALACGARVRPALREGKLPGAGDDLQYRLADRLVLRKVRNLFGPSLELAMVGAAPIARDLLEFFDACGVLVLEGYGLTESCAAATVNTVDALRFGTVGKPLPGTDVAIAPDGEILLRGAHVFKGYFHDREATDEIVDRDGWLHTGDLGAMDDGFLCITGRKKDLIITSSGKNIAPVNIENLLRARRYIAEAVVYGDRRPYLVAMLTLDRDESVKLAERLGIDTDPAGIARHPEVRAVIQKEIDAANRALARIEQVKRFAILDSPLTQDEGELTPTLKVKRAYVYDKYADRFADLYAREDNS